MHFKEKCSFLWLGGGNSIFIDFHPKNWGRLVHPFWLLHFFFKWVGWKNPPSPVDHWRWRRCERRSSREEWDWWASLRGVDPCVSRANFLPREVGKPPTVHWSVLKRKDQSNHYIPMWRKDKTCIKHASFSVGKIWTPKVSLCMNSWLATFHTILLPILSTVGTVEFPVQESSVFLDGLTCKAIRQPLVTQMKRCRFLNWRTWKLKKVSYKN